MGCFCVEDLNPSQNKVVKNGRFRQGQKRSSFVRGDRCKEPKAAIRQPSNFGIVSDPTLPPVAKFPIV